MTAAWLLSVHTWPCLPMATKGHLLKNIDFKKENLYSTTFLERKASALIYI